MHTFCCSESFSKPCAYLNSEGSTLMFHPLLICTVKWTNAIKKNGAHGYIAFLPVKWLNSSDLCHQHRLCLILNLLETNFILPQASQTHKIRSRHNSVAQVCFPVLNCGRLSVARVTPALKTCHRRAGTSHLQPPVVQSTGSFSSSAKHTSVNHAESAPQSHAQLRYHLRATMSFLSEMVTFQFFIFIAICWCSAAGLYANRVYATNIFLQFKCLIQPFICCQQNIKACRLLEADKTVWKDEDYNYCHRCPTKRALQCFSSPCLSLNVITYRVKIKRWGHYWSALTTSWILSYF